jgi:hypothetical protein
MSFLLLLLNADKACQLEHGWMVDNERECLS